MASLKATILEDMKAAMRAKEQARLDVIRLIQAAIKQREVDERKTLEDTEVIATLDKMLKMRRESIAQYQAANREDLAAKEQAEIDIIVQYLPEPLGEDELKQLIQQAIDSSGAASMKDMGKVMAILKPKVQGRTDMGQLSQAIKGLLS